LPFEVDFTRLLTANTAFLASHNLNTLL